MQKEAFQTSGSSPGQSKGHNRKLHETNRAVCKAEDAKLLHRIDRGQGIKGAFCTLYGLVGESETFQQALDAGIASKEYQERILAKEAMPVVPAVAA